MARELRLEREYVAELVNSEIGLISRLPKHRKNLHSLWERHALSLPPGWFREFVHNCRKHAEQDTAFLTPLAVASKDSDVNLQALARLLVKVSRHIALASSDGATR